jgi:hypothetical protein
LHLHSPAYRPWAKLLLSLILLTWTFRMVHGVWLHHDGGTDVSCSAEHRGTAPHWHAGQGEERDCPFCAFVFAVPELLPVAAFAEPPVAQPESKAILPQAPAPTRTADATIRLRGPPAA